MDLCLFQAGVGFRFQQLHRKGIEERVGLRRRFVLDRWRFVGRRRLRIIGLVDEPSAAVLFGGAVAGDGVAAEAQDHRQGKVIRHGQAERPQGGEAEADDLRDGDEVGVIAGAVVVDGFERGQPGEADVAGCDAEEYGRDEGDDEGQEEIGPGAGIVRVGFFVGGGLGHGAPGLEVMWVDTTLGCGGMSR